MSVTNVSSHTHYITKKGFWGEQQIPVTEYVRSDGSKHISSREETWYGVKDVDVYISSSGNARIEETPIVPVFCRKGTY